MDKGGDNSLLWALALVAGVAVLGIALASISAAKAQAAITEAAYGASESAAKQSKSVWASIGKGMALLFSRDAGGEKQAAATSDEGLPVFETGMLV